MTTEKYFKDWNERIVPLMKLKQLIKKKFGKIESFAEALGTARGNVSAIMSGRGRVLPTEIDTWSDLLEISKAELIELLGGQ